MMSHLESVPLYTANSYNHLPAVVALGGVAILRNIALRVIVLVAPLSFITINSIFPSTGVPDGALMVVFTANAVTNNLFL